MSERALLPPAPRPRVRRRVTLSGTILTPPSYSSTTIAAFTANAPSLRLLPYWGNVEDRAKLRAFLSTGSMYAKEADLHVIIVPYESLVGELFQFKTAIYQLLLLHDGLPLLANENFRRARAGVLRLRARSRMLVTRSLANPCGLSVGLCMIETLRALVGRN